MSKRIAVSYCSKYGSTERYATWLAKILGADLFQTKKLKAGQLADYDTIIVCGNIVASMFGGASAIKKQDLKGKQVVLLAVGASPEDQKFLEEFKQNNFKDTPLSDAKLFYLRGAFDAKSMSFVDRSMCSMLKKSIQKKDKAALSEWEMQFVTYFDQPNDWTSEESLAPIVEYVNTLV